MFLDVLLFTLGVIWMAGLWPMLPQRLKELRGEGKDRDGQMLSAMILAVSAYWLLWMIQMLWRLLIAPWL